MISFPLIRKSKVRCVSFIRTIYYFPIQLFPLQRHYEYTIIFSNDRECSLRTETKLLTLSSCDDSEFTCNNGLCVPIGIQ